MSVLRQLAEIDPDRAALTCGDVTFTHGGFVDRVERLAALFAARGVAEGSTVTIGLPNSIGFVESMFAAWAVGAVPQPVSHRLPPPERVAITDLASPSLVVGMPQPEAGAWPALESVPQKLPAGSFTPGVSPAWKLARITAGAGVINKIFIVINKIFISPDRSPTVTKAARMRASARHRPESVRPVMNSPLSWPVTPQDARLRAPQGPGNPSGAPVLTITCRDTNLVQEQEARHHRTSQ